MKVKAIDVEQFGNVFYVCKMKAIDLINIATTKIRNSKSKEEHKNYLEQIDYLTTKEVSEGSVWYLEGFEDKENIQRQKSKKRLIEIGNYLDSERAIFPNSIICNINTFGDDNACKFLNGFLMFDETKTEVSVIDGQHRLGGFGFANKSNKLLNEYELIVTFLVGLKPSQQAELFSIINGKQKPVSKSVLYDLSSMTQDEYSAQLMAHLITQWFNMNEISPLYNRVKMLGVGEGSISQAALIDALMPLFDGKKRDSSQLEISIFNKYFINKDSKTIVQHLLDYFVIISTVFKKYWNSDSDSVLLKTTGLVGCLKAYPTFYLYLYNNHINDRKDKYEKLKKLIYSAYDHEFTPTSQNYRGGGASLQKQFARDLLSAAFGSQDIDQGIRETALSNMERN